MLSLTEAAAAHLTEVLTDVPGQAAVRFTVNDQSLTPQLDMPRENDVTFQHEGRTVLLIEPELAGMLSDRVLDARSTEGGTRLVLRVQAHQDTAD